MDCSIWRICCDRTKIKILGKRRCKTTPEMMILVFFNRRKVLVTRNLSRRGRNSHAVEKKSYREKFLKAIPPSFVLADIHRGSEKFSSCQGWAQPARSLLNALLENIILKYLYPSDHMHKIFHSRLSSALFIFRAEWISSWENGLWHRGNSKSVCLG